MTAENHRDVGRRMVVAGGTEALDSFADVVTSWIVPFIAKWRQTGLQPIPSPDNVSEICSFIDGMSATVPLPHGYDWLPKLVRELACSTRFNNRNFVNIHPNPHVPSLAASLAVALQNPNNIIAAVSKATTKLEEDCVAWMARNLVGFDPDRATGNVVSGGTVANLTALLVARDYCYRKLARPRPAELRSRGLWNCPTGTILATAGSHYSVKKAAWILGIGDENVVRVPVAFDEEGYLRAHRDKRFIEGIRQQYWADLVVKSCEEDMRRGDQELLRFYRGDHEPFTLQPLDSEIYKALYGCFEYQTPLLAYVFTIGTTDTGTVERPDHRALKLLEEEDVFVHADAAAGGFALLHDRVREKTTGLKNVNSITIDAHKLGHLSYPNGTILFKDRGWVLDILHDAPYLRNLAPTVEGSRPGTNVAALWAAIQDLGETRRYYGWLDRLFNFMDKLVEAFKASNKFQILHSVDLTTIAVAPRAEQGQTRHYLNDISRRMSEVVERDTDSNAYLVNFDRELAGIKVRNSNTFHGSTELASDDSLVDIQCLRIVTTNPEVDAADAPKLVEYLERQLADVSGGR